MINKIVLIIISNKYNILGLLMDRLNFPVDIFENLSSSDSEEEQRRPRNIKTRISLIDELDEVEFQRRFRLSKDGVRRLINLLPDNFRPRNNKNHPISKTNQVLICLRYFAIASFQINIGDLFAVSQPTVSRIVAKISSAIAGLLPQFITMPANEDQLLHAVQSFYNIAGFPNVIGCIDCTHIRLKSPGGNDSERLRNRKGWFSINTQVVGNAEPKICDVVARWPGSVHDSTIFNNSFMRARCENGEFRNKYLLGDSGYACKPYLLTPLLEVNNNAEERYNNAHIRTRNSVERLFGVWKRRFPCLSLGMNVDPVKACNTIIATAVLHNMCIDMRDEVPEPDNEVPRPPDNFVNVNNVGLGNDNTTVRNAVIRTVFN